MRASGTRIRKRLDALRRQHADRLSPLRFHFIEVLERRAAGYDGETRRLLDERLSGLIDAYAAGIDIAAPKAGESAPACAPSVPTRGALGGLLDDLAKRPAAGDGDTRASPSDPAAWPAVEALDTFRSLWSEVRVQSQMRQSLAQVPADAGPLNSGSLVHRSLTLMHELSPAYLQHFLSYIDTLSWLEQMQDGGALSTRETSRDASPAKRPRAKTARPR